MSSPSDLDILEEAELVEQILGPYPSDAPRMIQIGANEGMYEYAKEDGKDFVFEFLAAYGAWDAVLVEPIPAIFDKLKANYARHDNVITFLNCAIAETTQQRALVLSGKDGKGSRLSSVARQVDAGSERVMVQCIDYAVMCRLVNWARVDFVKIDAEGYDEHIVAQIMNVRDQIALPKYLMWEQLGPERLGTSEKLTDLGYKIYRTGLAKNGAYLDRLACLPQEGAP